MASGRSSATLVKFLKYGFGEGWRSPVGPMMRNTEELLKSCGAEEYLT
jgi:hypothetical protein